MLFNLKLMNINGITINENYMLDPYLKIGNFENVRKDSLLWNKFVLMFHYLFS